MMVTVGVLALQGNFGAHGAILSKLGAKWKEVRKPEDLESLDALIIPGGESTSIMRLIQRAKLFEPIAEFAKQRPIFGTCAGSILMATKVIKFDLPTFALLDIEVERNAYGSQSESEIDTIEFDHRLIEVAFIRAPKIHSILGESEKVLAYREDSPVIVCNQQHMAATCHPEFLHNTAIHAYFLKHFV